MGSSINYVVSVRVGRRDRKLWIITYIVKRRQSREEGQKLPTMRRHSFWTAPISISQMIPIIYAIKVLLAKLWNPDEKWSKSHKNIKIVWHLHTKDSLSILVERLTRVHFVIKAYVLCTAIRIYNIIRSTIWIWIQRQ